MPRRAFKNDYFTLIHSEISFQKNTILHAYVTRCNCVNTEFAEYCEVNAINLRLAVWCMQYALSLCI